MAAPQIIMTPKSYWITRRREGHSDWAAAFWRELFQNAGDAGAKRVDITISDAPGQGAFGRDPSVDRVVRVTFADDGKGMNGDVLQNVFFSPGESTKRGESGKTGGFGTARLMLCFSQARYAIRTQDWMVEGDGSEYTCLTVAEAIEGKRADIKAAIFEAASLEARLPDSEEQDRIVEGFANEARRADIAARMARGEDIDNTDVAAAVAAVVARERGVFAARVDEIRRADARLGFLRADLAALEAEAGSVKGCRFEIDVDPAETGTWRDVDRNKLLSKLDEYLSLSQIPFKVYLNGEERTERTQRGPAKRKLVAEVDGRETVFGSIHTSQGERARHKGKIIVRVDGAAMFTDSTAASHQVIIEIDPAMSREVLTENRDGLKHPYRGAMENFIQELVVDSRSALEDKDKRKHVEFKGGRGTHRVSLEAPKVSYKAEGPVRTGRDAANEPAAPDVDESGTVNVAPERPAARYATAEEYEVKGFGGVARPVVDGFLAAVAAGEDTFLEHFADQAEADGFRDSVVRAAADGDVAVALGDASPALAEFVAATLDARVAEAAPAAAAAAAANRLADMNDVHIQIDDIGDDEKLKTAVRRYSPGYWRRKGEHLEGRGMKAHMLLAAWTVCCEHAVRALLAVRPDAAKDGGVEFSTGFYFGKATRVWDSTRQAWHDKRTGAQHQKRGDLDLLLLNPVLDDGHEAWDLGRDRRGAGDVEFGLQNMEQDAIHEACHILRNYHDEDFANLQGDVAGMFDRAACRAAMRDAIDAVRAAYGRGRTRIQAMDAPEEVAVYDAEDDKPQAARKAKRPATPRPAERLLAHAAPVATMLAGTIAAPENEGAANGPLGETFFGAVTLTEDGVAEVDCDRIQRLETGLAAAAAAGWDEAAIDLDAVLGDVSNVATQPDEAGIDLDAILGDGLLGVDGTVEAPLSLGAVADAAVESALAGFAVSEGVVVRGMTWDDTPIDLGTVFDDAHDLAHGLADLADLASIAAPVVATPVAASPVAAPPRTVRKAPLPAAPLPPVVADTGLVTLDLGGDFDFAELEDAPPVVGPRR